MRSVGSVLTDRSADIFPIAPGAFLGAAHARQHILFDHDPARVVHRPQLGQDRREVDVALAQLTEEPLAHYVHAVPSLLARTRSDLRVVILEVDVPDAVGMAPQAGHRIAPAEAVVPRVEAESQDLGVGHAHQPRRLFRRLDPGADVVMEDGAQPRLTFYRPRNAIGALGEHLPLGFAHPLVGPDAPGIERAHGIHVGIVAQHDEIVGTADLG